MVKSKRNWSPCAADSLSHRDRYPIKFDNRFTLVTRVVEYTRGQMQQAGMSADGFGVMLNLEFMFMLHLTMFFLCLACRFCCGTNDIQEFFEEIELLLFTILHSSLTEKSTINVHMISIMFGTYLVKQNKFRFFL